MSTTASWLASHVELACRQKAHSGEFRIFLVLQFNGWVFGNIYWKSWFFHDIWDFPKAFCLEHLEPIHWTLGNCSGDSCHEFQLSLSWDPTRLPKTRWPSTNCQQVLPKFLRFHWGFIGVSGFPSDATSSMSITEFVWRFTGKELEKPVTPWKILGKSMEKFVVNGKFHGKSWKIPGKSLQLVPFSSSSIQAWTAIGSEMRPAARASSRSGMEWPPSQVRCAGPTSWSGSVNGI